MVVLSRVGKTTDSRVVNTLTAGTVKKTTITFLYLNNFKK